MNSISPRWWLASVAVVAAMLADLHAQYRYTLLDLGDITPTSVNDIGQVVGYRPVGSATRAVMYHYGRITELGTLGGSDSRASAINNRGEIVGSSTTATGVRHAFLFSNGTMVDITPAASDAGAADINDTGHIAGGYEGEVFVYANGVLSVIPIPGDSTARSMAINNRDEVAYSIPHAIYLYSGGASRSIYEQADVTLRDMNDHGDVVGHYGLSFFQHALIYSRGVIRELSPPSGYNNAEAVGINNVGHVAVNGSIPRGDVRAFLYVHGSYVALNSQVDLASSPFSYLERVIAISDVGFIIGRAWPKSSGGFRYFLLMPISQGTPTWWAARSVFAPGKSPQDFAAANQGQAKYFATKAYDELQSKLAGGAGAALTQLIASWSNTDGASDYAVINHGQLKTIAKPFYDRLVQVGYHGPPLPTGQVYPWNSFAEPADFAVANIGQLKHLFSFDLGSSNTDHDGDGLPDWWERWHFNAITAHNASGDPDGDGMSNQQEYTLGSSPTIPNG